MVIDKSIQNLGQRDKTISLGTRKATSAIARVGIGGIESLTSDAQQYRNLGAARFITRTMGIVNIKMVGHLLYAEGSLSERSDNVTGNTVEYANRFLEARDMFLVRSKVKGWSVGPRITGEIVGDLYVRED